MSFAPLENLLGQTAVITGANGGIGRAVAQALAQRQARIIAVVRGDPTIMQRYLDSLPNADLGHRAALADVRDTAQLLQVRAEIDRCDILVTSAGHSRPIAHADLESLTDDFIDEMLTANLRSVIATIRTFLPMLSISDNGLVVNIGSGSAVRPGHGSNLAYAAAKAGVENLTKNLALALAPQVRCISICPSSMNTGFLPHGQDFYDRAAQETPLGRIATPQDVAAVVESCATKMRYMTGHCFVVDGGRTI